MDLTTIVIVLLVVAVLGGGRLGLLAVAPVARGAR